MRRALVFMLGISSLSSVGCGDGPSCPEGTRKVGSQCAPIEGDAGADGGSTQQDMSSSTADDAVKDAGRGGKPGHAKPDASDTSVTGQPADASVDAEVMSCLIDADHDGYGRPGAPGECALLITSDGGAGDGGAGTQPGDCADGDPKIHPDVSMDLCDRIDNDCDGTIDEGVTETCNGADDDCDGMVDEEVKNACGGCSVLVHAVGSTCNNGARGACYRTGYWQCDGAEATRCDAPVITPAAEVCGDNVDNDCDGLADEDNAVGSTPWYRDCDGDGYAGNTIGMRPTCAKPQPVAGCKAWTDKAPSKETRTWDCNDTSAAYAPGKGFGYPSGGGDFDLNCDLNPEPERKAHEGSSATWELCEKSGQCNCIVWVGRAIGETAPCSSSPSDTHAVKSYSTFNQAGTCQAGGFEATQLCR